MTISKKWCERKFAAFDVKMTKNKKFYGTKICKQIIRKTLSKKD